MRVTLFDEDNDPLGSFVLVNGKVEIDCPPDGMRMFKDTLTERVLALDEDLNVVQSSEGVTATSDPEGWMRGLLLQYSSYKLHAELDDDEEEG